MRPTQIQRSLADKATVIADIYATWRISDPQKLLRNAYGDENTAASRLSSAINTAAGEVLGKKNLSDLVNTDAAKVQLDEIEESILELVEDRDVADDNGLELISLGIASIRFPQSTTKAVFERMQAERETRKEQLLSEGRRKGQELLSEAQKEAAQLNNGAARQAKALYAEAQLAALDSYKTLTAAPELATYLRRLDAFRSIASSALANEQPLLFVLTTASGVFSALTDANTGEGMDLPEPPQPVEVPQVGGED
jgi:membrane protease subunit HflC